MPIPKDHERLVTIPLLEFLAVCGNILTFHPYLTGLVGDNTAILLRTDALTTALTLPQQTQRSTSLMQAYMQLHASTEFRDLKPHLHIEHIWGDSNALSDRASRAKWDEFQQLCAQLQVKPQRIPIPQSFHRMYLQLIRSAAHPATNIRGGARPSLLDRLRPDPNPNPNPNPNPDPNPHPRLRAGWSRSRDSSNSAAPAAPSGD